MSPSFTVDLNIPIVCITCYGRSGSFLLQGLLDNHPNVMSVPSHALIKFDKFLSAVASRSNLSVSGVIQNFTRQFPYLFSETDQSKKLGVASDMISIGVPQKEFVEILSKILTSTRPNHNSPAVLIRAIHYSYDYCLGRDVGCAKLIVWQRHSPFVDEREKSWVSNNLGNVKFLVPVRRPDVALSSHFSHKNFHGEDKPITGIQHLLTQLAAAGRVHSTLDPFSRAIRFEDMHTRTEDLTKSIAKWLGIDWDVRFLEPTIDGKEQLFPKHNNVVRGLNKNIEKEQSSPHLTFLDRLLFESVNYRAYKAWGYTTSTKFNCLNWIIRNIGIYIPMQMEISNFLRDLRENKDLGQAIQTAYQRRKEVITVMRYLLSLNLGHHEEFNLLTQLR